MNNKNYICHENNKNLFLFNSSLLLLLPIIIYLIKDNKSQCENNLAIILCINVIISCLFWIRPNPYSLIHYLDSFFSRLSIIIFTVYIIFYKSLCVSAKIFYLIILIFCLFNFTKSNKNSKKKWCSNEHIFYHINSHFLCNIGCLIAFI